MSFETDYTIYTYFICHRKIKKTEKTKLNFTIIIKLEQ